MLATSKHVFKIKTCRNLFKNYDLLSAVSAFWLQYQYIFKKTCEENKKENHQPGDIRVRTGPGKPGKSWNFILAFSRTGKSCKKENGPGKL